MSVKVYLSPSSQTDNKYSYDNYTEAEVCREIGEKCYNYLKNVSGISVKLATDGYTVSQRVTESNNYGADVHIPIHTNAGGGDGTLVMCYTGYTSNKYVTSIYNNVAAVSPGADDGIKTNTSLAEITGTKAIAVYVECEFHDDSTLAKWIVENTDTLAKAIAQGVCDGAGLSTVIGESSSSSTSSASSSKLYKVQAGAFTKKSNAESLVSELTEDGFNTYLYYDNGYYKVQVGAYSKKANAETLVQQLKDVGYNAYVYYG